jgi:hypothetical protein
MKIDYGWATGGTVRLTKAGSMDYIYLLLNVETSVEVTGVLYIVRWQTSIARPLRVNRGF